MRFSKSRAKSISVQVRASLQFLKPIYVGKRVKRGLFKSKNGKYINADLNGAINIMRKVIGDIDFINQPILDLVFNPVKINLPKLMLTNN